MSNISNFGCPDPARTSSILGMVSGIRRRSVAARRHCCRAFCDNYDRLDAVFWLVVSAGVRHRSCSSGHGWTLGRFLPPLGGSGSFWSYRLSDRNETSAQRRGRNNADGSVLPCQWSVSVYRLNMACTAGLGLASGGRCHHVSLGHPCACAMACLRTLGNRSLYWNRLNLLRRRVDWACSGLARKLTLYRVGDSRAHIKWIEAIAAIARN